MGPPCPPLRALWEAGAEGEWLLQGAELELLASPQEALEFLQEDPEESSALARAQRRLFEEMALVAWSEEGHCLALWRFAPEQSWEQAATVALDEKVGFYCKAASLADHVVLTLREREEEAIAWFRERGSNVNTSLAEARARLRWLPSPEYRLHRYQQEEEARQRGERPLHAPPVAACGARAVALNSSACVRQTPAISANSIQTDSPALRGRAGSHGSARLTL